MAAMAEDKQEYQEEPFDMIECYISYLGWGNLITCCE